MNHLVSDLEDRVMKRMNICTEREMRNRIYQGLCKIRQLVSETHICPEGSCHVKQIKVELNMSYLLQHKVRAGPVHIDGCKEFFLSLSHVMSHVTMKMTGSHNESPWLHAHVHK